MSIWWSHLYVHAEMMWKTWNTSARTVISSRRQGTKYGKNKGWIWGNSTQRKSLRGTQKSQMITTQSCLQPSKKISSWQKDSTRVLLICQWYPRHAQQYLIYLKKCLDYIKKSKLHTQKIYHGNRLNQFE